MGNAKPPLDTILDGKEFAFYTGLVFRGLSISETSGGFNVVIRATRPLGDLVYCMVSHEDPQQGLKNLLNSVSVKGGESLWRYDKFSNQRNAA